MSWVFAHRLAFPAVQGGEGQISLREPAAETLSSFLPVLFPGRGWRDQDANFPQNATSQNSLLHPCLFPPSWTSPFHWGIYRCKSTGPLTYDLAIPTLYSYLGGLGLEENWLSRVGGVGVRGQRAVHKHKSKLRPPVKLRCGLISHLHDHHYNACYWI